MYFYPFGGQSGGMGLRDRLFGGGGDDPPGGGGGGDGGWTHDHYEVKHFPAEGNKGWQQVEVGGQAEWGYPITEREFRANMPELEPGKYRLWSVDTNNIHHPPKEEDEGWVISVEDDTPSRAESSGERATRRVEQKIDQLEARLEEQNGMPHDPEKMTEYARAQIAMGALNSPEFLNRYGAEIAMGVLGGSKDKGEMGFDEWSDSPIGATIFQAINDPQKVEQLGEAAGKAGSSFMGGFMTQMDGEGRTLRTDSERAQPDDTTEATPPEEASEPTPDSSETGGGASVDAGASSLDGLADSVPNDGVPGMDEVTEEFAETNVALQDQRDSETNGEYPDPEAAETPDPVEVPDSAEEGEPAPDPDPEPGTVNRAGLPTPETPSDLRGMSWNELQKLASEEGLNPTEYGGKDALVGELERVLFGVPDDDPDGMPSGSSPDPDPDDGLAADDAADDAPVDSGDDADGSAAADSDDADDGEIEINNDTTSSGPSTDNPDAIAEQL